MGTVIPLRKRIMLPDGRDPTTALDSDIVDMIGEMCGVANRLRARESQNQDDIKAAEWLTFMAAVLTTKLE